MENSETKEIQKLEREMDIAWINYKVKEIRYKSIVDEGYIEESMQNDFKELSEFIQLNLLDIA
ncbi:hypothetical protein LJR015_004003 [Peribacillus frigoritolerans]|uniref:hypothetical protein n=1 Tax=Peribacillus frigoritolerans TaxID=450367 RepID=UPI003ECE68CD